MKKLPHHGHNPEDLGGYGETLALQQIPQIDWQRMAADAWAEFLMQLGTLTAAQVKIVLDTWSKVVDPAALGDLLAELVKVGTGTYKWLSDFFTGYGTSNPKLDIDKLNIIPYKLPTSAYNYILNPSFEYPTPTVTGIADSGNTTTTVDAARTESDDHWNGKYIRFTSGFNIGLSRVITDFVNSTHTITHAAFPNTVDLDDEYDIIPTELIHPWGGSEIQDPYIVKFGKYSGKLVAAGSDVDGGWSNYIDVRGLTELTIAVWMRVLSRTAGLFQCWVEYYDKNKVYVADSMLKIGELSAVASWTQKTLTDSDLPSGACFARVRNVWRDTPTGTGYVDGWQLNVGDQTPAFQDFTTYSYKWMPEKLETTLSTSLSWTYDTWTDVLELVFDCESKMMCLIFGYANAMIHNDNAGIQDCTMGLELNIDGAYIAGTLGYVGLESLAASGHLHGCYGTHTVIILEKGSHTLKMRIARLAGDATAYVTERRITILKGFYQGGAT